jgi:UDP-glucose 4-epimerase
VSCKWLNEVSEMRVVVTGGAGFIGSHTVDLLVENGHEVMVIDSKLDKSFHHKNANYYLEDILDKKKVNELFQSFQPEAVIHLAAQVDVQHSMEHPDHDIDINLKGTIHILEQCRLYGSKIIFASSAAVYGIPKLLPITEDHDKKPLSIYGLSKLTAEHYIQLYHELYNVSYCILRYANVYGPRQNSSGEGGVVSIFVDQLVQNIVPSIYGNGEQTRDFVYVKDVARANVLALDHHENEIFNVCNTSETSINELFTHISKLLKTDSVPVYKTEKKGDIFRSVLDSAKIIKTLKWNRKTDLLAGLVETVQFFQTKNRQDKEGLN